MQDNIIIENMEFTEEIYRQALRENIFDEDNLHGIGDDRYENSKNVSAGK